MVAIQRSTHSLHVAKSHAQTGPDYLRNPRSFQSPGHGQQFVCASRRLLKMPCSPVSLSNNPWISLRPSLIPPWCTGSLRETGFSGLVLLERALAVPVTGGAPGRRLAVALSECVHIARGH